MKKLINRPALVPWGIAMVAAAALAGCSTAPNPVPSQAAGDCTTQIRADGIVYSSHGSTRRAATKHASAVESACHDNGPDAAGSVFLESSRQLTTWRFAGHAPAEVLGVGGEGGSFAVFVSDTVAEGVRDEIYADLTKAGR
jgi:hypothetical protein